MNAYSYFDTIKRKLLNCPLSIQFEISNKCVAKCVTCLYKKQNVTNDYSSNSIIKVIDNLAKHGLKAIRLTGGEPIISDSFCTIASCCLNNKLKTSITTTLLTNKVENIEILKRLLVKISLSTVNDNYVDFFNIDNKYFSIVKKNLDILRKLKKRFSVNYTIFDKNYSKESIYSFVDFINNYKPFYVTFFPALNYHSIDLKNKQEIVNNFKEISKFMKFRSNAKTIEKHFVRRLERKNIVCHINKFHAHVKRDGSVYPCCMTGGEIGQNLDTKFLMGNIFKEDIIDIYKRNYDMFKNINLAKNKICQECTQRYLLINMQYESFLKSNNFREI